MGARKLYEEKIMELLKRISDDQLPKVVSMIEKEANEADSAIHIDKDAFETLPEEDFKKKLEENREQYLKAVEEGAGKFKGMLSSTEEFLKRKHEDKFLDREYRV